MKRPWPSYVHKWQADYLAEKRKQYASDGHNNLVHAVTEMRIQKLYDAEVEKRREALRERVMK